MTECGYPLNRSAQVVVERYWFCQWRAEYSDGRCVNHSIDPDAVRRRADRARRRRAMTRRGRWRKEMMEDGRTANAAHMAQEIRRLTPLHQWMLRVVADEIGGLTE